MKNEFASLHGMRLLQGSADSDLIHQAKQEWEGAVDCMAQLILVLSAQGNVIRANRTTEYWGLGRVDKVRGKNLHDLLHPSCTSKACRLEQFWQTAQPQLLQGHAASFESDDRQLGRFIEIIAKPSRATLEGKGSHDNLFAIVEIDDVTELRKNESNFKQRTDELEYRVRARTTELELMNRQLVIEIEIRNQVERENMESVAALRKSEAELRLLSKQVLAVQEMERKRIAGDLHDGLGQTLSLMKFCVEDSQRLIAQGALSDAGSLLVLLIGKIKDAVSDVRRITMDLRPSLLDDLGILATISWFSREYECAYRHIKVQQKIAIEESDVPDPLKTAIYRVLQEAMNNSAKHAAASMVQISLSKCGDAIELGIMDNGKGFDSASRSTVRDDARGFGLTSMHDRATLSGGIYKIESAPGKGTNIHISWPIRERVASVAGNSAKVDGYAWFIEKSNSHFSQT